MGAIELIIGGLATWRLSHMVVKENGPLMVFARARAFFARHQKRSGGFFDLISCVYCVSFWIGLIAALFASHNVFHILAYALTFSAIATIIMVLLQKLDALAVVTRPTTDNKVSVSASPAPEKRDDVIGHPYSAYGKTAVEASASLHN
jgi:uncharacterized membrane protein